MCKGTTFLIVRTIIKGGERIK